MQQALRESPFARQEVWSFIPFLYRLADDRNECLRLALAHLEAFTDLWQGEPPFLADPHNTEFVKELASAAKRRVQLLGAHQTGSADVKIGALMERLNGRPDNRQYALAALLEDKTWDSEGNQGRPGPTTRCSETRFLICVSFELLISITAEGIIHDRIKEVHLRLLGAPDLSSELSKKEMASCATVWFGFLKWQSLTRYQLLMVRSKEPDHSSAERRVLPLAKPSLTVLIFTSLSQRF